MSHGTLIEAKRPRHFSVVGSIRRAAHEAALEARAEEAGDEDAARQPKGQEVHDLIAEIEQSIGRMKDATEPELSLVRANVRASIAALSDAIVEGADWIQQQTWEAIDASDNFVRRRPWNAIGIASAAALAIGMMLGRR
jgi:ElaB/YqjD/DUF883 family membrane-anchored ribosome-binding protein